MVRYMMLVMMLSGCVSGWVGGTVVGPMPLKVGEMREDSIELGIPLVTEKKVTGGWRSPVEVRIRVLLTSPIGLFIPLEPNGVVGGVRIRW